MDSGVKQAQLFVGKESLVSDIYPMMSGKQFVNTLEDNIHRCSAMDKLISELAKIQISHKVKNILRAYNINGWQSEPCHQNQTPAVWMYRTIKAWANTIMNRTGAPAYCWLLTLQYVCYILIHISTTPLVGQVPLQALYGVTADITDRIPSTTPGAEPPRDAKDSGSARSHSTHLETSSSNRP